MQLAWARAESASQDTQAAEAACKPSPERKNGYGNNSDLEKNKARGEKVQGAGPIELAGDLSAALMF